MFYDTRIGDHGLPHNPFKACVVPRPIGWITSVNEAGVVNLAPYSFFNGVAGDPPCVMFSPGGRKTDGPPDGSKDSLANVERTGEFVCNVVTWDLREAMNVTSAPAPAGVDEAAVAGLEMVPSKLVKPPRVKASPIHMECKYLQTVGQAEAHRAARLHGLLPGRGGLRHSASVLAPEERTGQAAQRRRVAVPAR